MHISAVQFVVESKGTEHRPQYEGGQLVQFAVLLPAAAMSLLTMG